MRIREGQAINAALAAQHGQAALDCATRELPPDSDVRIHLANVKRKATRAVHFAHLALGAEELAR